MFTTRQVLEGAEPILHVSHDSDDHGWQFLSREAREADGKIIALGEAVELDPSILQLADLPPGWHAWRDSIAHAWTREAMDDSTRTI